LRRREGSGKEDAEEEKLKFHRSRRREDESAVRVWRPALDREEAPAGIAVGSASALAAVCQKEPLWK